MCRQGRSRKRPTKKSRKCKGRGGKSKKGKGRKAKAETAEAEAEGAEAGQVRRQKAGHLRTLDGSPKELVGLLHEELVQGPVKGNVDGGGGLLPAPCPSCLLPQGRHRACNNHSGLEQTPWLGHKSVRASRDS